MINKSKPVFFILIVAILLSITLTTSCSTDDGGDNSDTNGDLVGTWRLISMEYNGDVFSELEGQESTSADFEGVASEIDVLTEFIDLGTFTSAGNYLIDLATTSSGQTSTQTVFIDDHDNTGVWERNGDVITHDKGFVRIRLIAAIVGQGMDMANSDILELTDTTLRLGNTIEQNFSDSGVTLNQNINVISVYTRE